MPRHPALASLVRRSNAIAAAALIALASGAVCAQATGNGLQSRLQKLGYSIGDDVEQVRNYRVDGWNYIDDNNIMIYAGPGKRYLITTQGHCSDLGSAENIGFSSTVGNVTRFDKLIVRGPGGMVQNCPISAIRALQKIQDGAAMRTTDNPQ